MEICESILCVYILCWLWQYECYECIPILSMQRWYLRLTPSYICQI
jgi:hypothetical protein